MPDQPEAEQSKPTGHTAVIYFHGMGSQRRFEESSRLIDAIDLYLSNSFHQHGQKLGILSKITPKIEPDRNKPDETITYIRTRHEGAETRIYEAYWAPIMAGSRAPMAVAKWILWQALRPFKTLRSPWRARHRLRRSALAELKERGPGSWPAHTDPDDFNKLLQDYVGFEKLNVTAQYPQGSFDNFLAFIKDQHQSAPETTIRLQKLARAWYRFYRHSEYRNIFILTTLFLAIVLCGGLLIWAVLMVLQQLQLVSFMGDSGLIFADFIRTRYPASVSTAAGLVSSGVLALGLRKFLSDKMGDVEAWATYEETDLKYKKRHRVLEVCGGLVKHVLADPKCKRVIVISHSLGTSVAHDTVLSLARDNRATNASDPICGPVKLDKIRHFVTIASPIDKINYFFESTRSRFHRYLRVVDTLRGDISKAPFSRNQKPHVHWVNFWDQADIISGALHSPVGRKSLNLRVDNVHVANLNAPDPGASHEAYFRNRTVISRLFEMIYLNKYSFDGLPLIAGKGYDYDSVMIGPGERKGLHRMFIAATLSLPWLGLLYLVLTLTKAGMISNIVLAVLLAIIAILALKMGVKKCLGVRQKL